MARKDLTYFNKVTSNFDGRTVRDASFLDNEDTRLRATASCIKALAERKGEDCDLPKKKSKYYPYPVSSFRTGSFNKTQSAILDFFMDRYSAYSGTIDRAQSDLSEAGYVVEEHDGKITATLTDFGVVYDIPEDRQAELEVFTDLAEQFGAERFVNDFLISFYADRATLVEHGAFNDGSFALFIEKQVDAFIKGKGELVESRGTVSEIYGGVSLIVRIMNEVDCSIDTTFGQELGEFLAGKLKGVSVKPQWRGTTKVRHGNGFDPLVDIHFEDSENFDTHIVLPETLFIESDTVVVGSRTLKFTPVDGIPFRKHVLSHKVCCGLPANYMKIRRGGGL